MTTKHTPGPWKAHLDQVAIVEMSDGHQFYVGGEDQSTDTIDANAALIAAAPDLLAALEAILPEFEMLYEQFDPDGQLGAWIEWSVMAQNAILKAKGSEQ